MDVLAAEYSRTYDPKIKAEIQGLIAQRREISLNVETNLHLAKFK
jgi:hypothetical protein